MFGRSFDLTIKREEPKPLYLWDSSIANDLVLNLLAKKLMEAINLKHMDMVIFLGKRYFLKDSGTYDRFLNSDLKAAYLNAHDIESSQYVIGITSCNLNINSTLHHKLTSHDKFAIDPYYIDVIDSLEAPEEVKNKGGKIYILSESQQIWLLLQQIQEKYPDEFKESFDGRMLLLWKLEKRIYEEASERLYDEFTRQIDDNATLNDQTLIDYKIISKRTYYGIGTRDEGWIANKLEKFEQRLARLDITHQLIYDLLCQIPPKSKAYPTVQDKLAAHHYANAPGFEDMSARVIYLREHVIKRLINVKESLEDHIFLQRVLYEFIYHHSPVTMLDFDLEKLINSFKEREQLISDLENVMNDDLSTEYLENIKELKREIITHEGDKGLDMLEEKQIALISDIENAQKARCLMM